VPDGGSSIPPLAGIVWPAWVLLAGSLLLACGLSALSALLERSGPIRLRQWAEDAGGRVLRIFENPPRFEAFRFLVNLVSRYALLTVLLAFLLVARSLEHRTLVSFLATGVLAIALELWNRSLVTKHAEAALGFGIWIYRLLALLLAPATLLLAGVPPFRPEGDTETPKAEEEQASEEEIEAFLDVGTKEGILEPSEAELVRGIVDFGDTVVKSVMTPRIDVIGVPREATVTEAVEFFLTSKHTRLPVYDGAVDQVVGFLHVIDVLAAFRLEPEPPLSSLVKPPLVVPETKPVNELLREFQATGQQIAVVVNEHGSTAGVATLEDLLEEIVGEIGSEYERPVRDEEELPGNVWRLDGGVHVERLGELFGVTLEDPPFETVGGLVLSVLGDVPRSGDSVDSLGLRFLVEKVDGRRIETVRVERGEREER
jgi:putative hemolysin